MEKKWYKSRVVWSGLLTAGFAAARAFGVLPHDMTDGSMDELVNAILGVATIYFRFDTTATLVK